MTAQLEAKVLSFIEKKNAEVDEWLQTEADRWSAAVNRDDSGQRELITSEEARILSRAQVERKHESLKP